MIGSESWNVRREIIDALAQVKPLARRAFEAMDDGRKSLIGIVPRQRPLTNTPPVDAPALLPHAGTWRFPEETVQHTIEIQLLQQPLAHEASIETQLLHQPLAHDYLNQMD